MHTCIVEAKQEKNKEKKQFCVRKRKSQKFKQFYKIEKTHEEIGHLVQFRISEILHLLNWVYFGLLLNKRVDD